MKKLIFTILLTSLASVVLAQAASGAKEYPVYPVYVPVQYTRLPHPGTCPAAIKQFFDNGGSLVATFDMGQAPIPPNYDGSAILEKQGSDFQVANDVTLYNEGLSNEVGLMSDETLPITIDGHPYSLERVIVYYNHRDNLHSFIKINDLILPSVKGCDIYSSNI